ncbi:MAG: site-specific integrase [Deltaproteobacteria bacterium]|nr:site-specific integrase [Deltaproteobacteria bacterium]
MRFAAFAEQWATTNAARLATSTRERYTRSICLAVTHLGDQFVDSLTPSDVRRYIDAIAPGKSPATVNGHLRVLRTVLEPLVEDEILTRNPARKVRGLPEKRTRGKRGTALSPSELRRFIEAAKELEAEGVIAPDIVRMILALAWTGMRRGELLALRFEDWKDGELTIERAAWRGEEKGTKTDDPRKIAVVGPLEALLVEQREWLKATQHEGAKSGLVFPASRKHAVAEYRRTGTLNWIRTGSVLDHPIAKIVKRAKVPAVSCHSFRRTWENLLRQAGVDTLVRRSLAGWRTDDAQAIYASVDPSERAQAARQVAAIVMGGQQ